MRLNQIEQVIDAARGAYLWRDLDTDVELAELIHTNVGEAVLVRGPLASAHRTLAFCCDSFGVEIELTGDGIESQLVPFEQGVVWLLTIAGCVAEADTDDIGYFWLPIRPRGPIRLACRLRNRRFKTCWITA